MSPQESIDGIKKRPVVIEGAALPLVIISPAAGAVAALTAICLPFFLMAPDTMFRMVVVAVAGSVQYPNELGNSKPGGL